MADHLAFPIAVTRQGLSSVAHDTDQDIAQSVELLLNTRPGERRSVPEYGLPDPVFSGADKADIAATVSEWEPRAQLDRLDVINTPNGPEIGYGADGYGDGYYGG